MTLPASQDLLFDSLPLPPRVRAQIRPHGATGCWEWQSYLTNGYGSLRLSRTKVVRAHRFVYELAVGGLDEALQIDHLCRNRRCVNPSHLEAVTQRENTMRGEGACARNARKIECPRGHVLVPDEGRNRRHCVECDRDARARSARVYAQKHRDRRNESNRQRRLRIQSDPVRYEEYKAKKREVERLRYAAKKAART